MSRNTKKSTKTKKNSKSAKSKKLVSKKSTKAGADYITVGGHRYERISNSCVEHELDLAEDVLNEIDKRVDNGEFVSRGDAIRYILRRVLESTEGLE